MKFFDLHFFKPFEAKENVKSQSLKSDDISDFTKSRPTASPQNFKPKSRPTASPQNFKPLMAQSFYNQNIKLYGCLFLSLVYKVNPRLLLLENAPAIERLYNQLIMSRFMRSDCYVLDRSAIMRYISHYYGGSEDRDLLIKKNLVRYSSNYDHFVVANRRGDIVYDPYVGGQYAG